MMVQNPNCILDYVLYPWKEWCLELTSLERVDPKASEKRKGENKSEERW